jgi:hypothetical protein
MSATLSVTQQELVRIAEEHGLPVEGRTAPDIPGWDGIVLRVPLGSKRLLPLEERGLRVCVAGEKHVIVEAAR